MVHVWTQDLPIDAEFYRGISEALGDAPIDGLLMHLCVQNPAGGLRYIDVWQSEEQCDRAFDERIHPAVDAAFGGARPPVEPVRTELEVVEIRGPVVDGVRA